MKRIIVLFVMVSMYHIVLFGQRKYEMVIEKTDGSEVVIKTEDISRMDHVDHGVGSTDHFSRIIF